MLWIPAFAGMTILKEFQLLTGGFGFHLFLAMEEFDHPKLLIGNLHNAHLPLFGQGIFGAFYMHGRIFPTGTEPHIDTELEHGKAIVQKILTKLGRILPVRQSLCWQVKKNEYPHATVLVETA